MKSCTDEDDGADSGRAEEVVGHDDRLSNSNRLGLNDAYYRWLRRGYSQYRPLRTIKHLQYKLQPLIASLQLNMFMLDVVLRHQYRNTGE